MADSPGCIAVIAAHEPDTMNLGAFLQASGYEVHLAHSDEVAAKICHGFRPQVALLDLELCSKGGGDLFGRLFGDYPEMFCVMLTDANAVKTAPAILHQRVHGFLRKPVDDTELLSTLDRCFDILRLQRRQRQLEVKLKKANEMEAFCLLADDVAHELNNVLTAIIGQASLAAERLPPSHCTQRDLVQILNAGQRGGALTATLLDFTRRHRPPTVAMLADEGARPGGREGASVL